MISMDGDTGEEVAYRILEETMAKCRRRPWYLEK